MVVWPWYGYVKSSSGYKLSNALVFILIRHTDRAGNDLVQTYFFTPKKNTSFNFVSQFLLLNFIYFIGSGKLWRCIWSLTLVMIIFLSSLVLMQLSVSPHVNASIFVTCAATYFLSNDIFLDLIWFVGNGYATCIIC